jgi:hypothetical protein
MPARTPDHRPSGRDPGLIQPSRRDTGQNSLTPGIWPDPAESPASPAGILLERRDPGQLARTAGFRSTSRDSADLFLIPAEIAGIRQKWPDSGEFRRNLYLPNLKNIFILTFFIL